MSALVERLVADHRAIEERLARAVRGPELDAAAFEEARALLLRHIAIEEKIMLRAVIEVRGAPLERAERMRRDHGAIASLLVPTPDAALVVELRTLLEPHDELEEGPGGVYAECAAILASRDAELAGRAASYPAVPMAKHHDGPEVARTAAAARAVAARMRVGGKRLG